MREKEEYIGGYNNVCAWTRLWLMRISNNEDK